MKQTSNVGFNNLYRQDLTMGDINILPVMLLVLSNFVEEYTCPPGRTKNDLNLSKGTPEPFAFWPISNDTHGDIGETNRLHADLYNVKLVDGPSAELLAMDFTGVANTYTYMLNDGSLNGQQSFSWVFYVYIEEPQTSVLMEYTGLGTGNGVRIELSELFINVVIYNTASEYIGNYKSDFQLVPMEWTYIGVNYNMIWGNVDIFTFYIDSTGNTAISTIIHDLEQQNIEINAQGDVVFGMGTDEGTGFKGRISCIQFYEKSMTGNYQKDVLDNCMSWTSFITDRTRDIEQTTVASTIAATTPLTTEPESETTTTLRATTNLVISTNVIIGGTAAETTTLPAISTPQTDMNTENDGEVSVQPERSTTDMNESSDVASTSTTYPVTETVKPEFPINNACFWFSMKRENVTFIDTAVQTGIVADLRACAKLCYQTTGCSAFVAELFLIESNSGTCSIGQASFDLRNEIGHRLYILQ